MVRSRSFRRHMRWVKIKKRLSYLNDNDYFKKQPGRLAKYNLTCGCSICKKEGYKRHGRRKNQFESEFEFKDAVQKFVEYKR